MADLTTELDSRESVGKTNRGSARRGAGGGYDQAQGYGDYEDWDEERVAIEIKIQRADQRMLAI